MHNVFCNLESERFKSFAIRQGYGLIAIVTVNFINFSLYCAKKAYMFWFFNPKNVANCKISPSIAAEAVESAQVSMRNKIYFKPLNIQWEITFLEALCFNFYVI